MTKQIKDNEFESEVINSKLPVLIDFWAEWCGPCRMLSPILDQLSEEMDGVQPKNALQEWINSSL